MAFGADECECGGALSAEPHSRRIFKPAFRAAHRVPGPLFRETLQTKPLSARIAKALDSRHFSSEKRGEFSVALMIGATQIAGSCVFDLTRDLALKNAATAQRVLDIRLCSREQGDDRPAVCKAVQVISPRLHHLGPFT
jgi:hypothetical protein